ncbi:MAG: hypothetical protein ACRD36_04080, partial [Candidatus Acidiferrum sp.]
IYPSVLQKRLSWSRVTKNLVFGWLREQKLMETSEANGFTFNGYKRPRVHRISVKFFRDFEDLIASMPDGKGEQAKETVE